MLWGGGTMVWKLLFGSACCYLYGSIPFAYLFTRWFSGKNLIEYGSGNAGVANTFRAGGLRAGYLTVVAELSKALLPVLISGYYSNRSLTLTLAWVFYSLLGTIYPVFFRFRGGRGRTVAGWATLFLSPLVAVAIGILWLTVSFLFKKPHLSFLIATFAYPFISLLISMKWPFFFFGLGVSALFLISSSKSKNEFERYRVFERLEEWNWGKGRNA